MKFLNLHTLSQNNINVALKPRPKMILKIEALELSMGPARKLGPDGTILQMLRKLGTKDTLKIPTLLNDRFIESRNKAIAALEFDLSRSRVLVSNLVAVKALQML